MLLNAAEFRGLVGATKVGVGCADAGEAETEADDVECGIGGCWFAISVNTHTHTRIYKHNCLIQGKVKENTKKK
jgi:hypothetical protein